MNLRRLGLLVPCIFALAACSAATDDGLDDGASELRDSDLVGKDFIHKLTYDAANSPGWTRNSVELEETNTVTCVDGPAMLKMLRSDAKGKTVYNKLRKTDTSEAFTTGYAIDEMPWDSDSHKLREQNPYVWLTIESGRYEIDPVSGQRELSLGTDIMDDTYYDTSDFKLLRHHMVLRGRARWDSPTEMRRILIGAKFGIEVDAFGVKSSAKIDERDDSATAEQIAAMDHDIRRGFDGWSGADKPAGPVREVYERLAAISANTLPNTTKYVDVLLLEPKADLRATRSRFHLNEAPLASVGGFTKNGDAKVDAVLAMIASGRGTGGFGANEPTIAAFEAKVRGQRDGSLLAQRATDKLKALDPAQDTSPAGIQTLLAAPMSAAVADKQRVLAETSSALYHELAADLDVIRRFITRSEDRTFENEPDLVVAWLKSADRPALGTTKAALAPQRTVDAFAAAYTRLLALPATQRATELTAYNDFGNAQKAAGSSDFKDFAPRTDADLKAIGAQVTCEEVRVWQREIETAGSAMVGLWFDKTRAFYVPGSSRVTSNVLIDTLDMTEMYEHASWLSIPTAERTAEKTLPLEKSFHGMLSNDVQIELGMEKPYMDRLAALTAQAASPERDKLLEGAKFVFGQYRAVMHEVGIVKADEVLGDLKKAGGPSCMKWGPVEQSKGETALSMIKAKK
jgi:hypothetical protein